MRFSVRRLGVSGLVVLILGGFCGPAAAQRAPVVAAASDLNFALTEIADGFAREHGQHVELVFGSSGTLARQIAMVPLSSSSSRPTKRW